MVTVININFNIDFINLITVFYKGFNYIQLKYGKYHRLLQVFLCSYPLILLFVII